MTEVAPSCTEMTALAPPPAPLITSRNASPARSPSSHNSLPEKSEVLRDKERRAQQQLDRCAEERGRKMEVQKRKEQQRRAAAEEKRRQQQEAEKERLEALVRRRAGGKRYTCHLERTKAADINADKVRHEAACCADIRLSVCVFLRYHTVLVFSAISLPSCRPPAKLYILRCFHNAINYSQYPSARAVLALTRVQGPPSSRPGSGPADWQRSCSGICRAQQNAHCSRNSSSISSYSPTRLEDRDSLKMQRRRRCTSVSEVCNALLSPLCFTCCPGNPKTPPCHAIGSAQPNGLPAASSASQSRNVSDFLSPPGMDQPINKQLSNSSAALHSPERVSFVSHRTASPNNHRPYRSSSNRRSIAGLPEEASKAKTPTRATTPGTDDRGHTELKSQGTLEKKSTKSEASEKKIPKSTSKELNAESPGTPTGRSVGGTKDAEEASRLLAERRRLARLQKEQEERQRQEDERLRAEEELRRQQEAKERQERAALQAEEERVRREEERRNKEDEERRQKEQRWKDMQDQLDREREEAFLRAQKEAERKRQERELLHIQEEQERLQRKKRIEEIMKRTRKSEVEPLSGVAASDMRPEAAVPSEEDAPTPAEAPVMLGPLENKSFVDELSDGVQSMDVSPVSRDEQPSAHEFSPLTEGTDGCPLEHLMELDAHARGQRQGGETPPYPKLQAGSGVGDLNKNLLIQAYSAASETSQLIHSVGPSKLDVQ
ncbi:MAP7 domain-containing protein 2 [Perca flavescens]|uniref:MAP7 domain-containing protein 2 n=1 Tax=Perca flavescens TaxID=8167 RepID=UPI00106E89C8|nr:MAP7 domain-containing protein 2-like [Perca flavescens]